MRLLVGMLSASASPRDDALKDAAESLVDSVAPGAIGCARDGDRHAAAGHADVPGKARADPRMRFRIASNTKAFTAAVILQLVGEKRLSLDAPVARWLPRLPGDITVRRLLNRRSGRRT